jgi:hypothetical protein
MLRPRHALEVDPCRETGGVTRHRCPPIPHVARRQMLSMMLFSVGLGRMAAEALTVSGM